jgi:hypothetical protein
LNAARVGAGARHDAALLRPFGRLNGQQWQQALAHVVRIKAEYETSYTCQGTAPRRVHVSQRARLAAGWRFSYAQPLRCNDPKCFFSMCSFLIFLLRQNYHTLKRGQADCLGRLP